MRFKAGAGDAGISRRGAEKAVRGWMRSSASCRICSSLFDDRHLELALAGRLTRLDRHHDGVDIRRQVARIQFLLNSKHAAVDGPERRDGHLPDETPGA